MNSNQLIVALDIVNLDRAKALVLQLEDRVSIYKVGPMLYTQSGPEMIRFLHQERKQIFIDLKLHDTPAVVHNTIRQLGDMGAHYVSIHCMGGKEMLHAAGLACRDSMLNLVGITLLTSQTNDEIGKFNETMVTLLHDAHETRLSGIICSPHELKILKPRALPGLKFFTPGIRIPGQEIFQDDQKRVASPQEALSWGADYLIVGRPITMGVDPVATVQGLLQ